MQQALCQLSRPVSGGLLQVLNWPLACAHAQAIPQHLCESLWRPSSVLPVLASLLHALLPWSTSLLHRGLPCIHFCLPFLHGCMSFLRELAVMLKTGRCGEPSGCCFCFPSPLCIAIAPASCCVGICT